MTTENKKRNEHHAFTPPATEPLFVSLITPISSRFLIETKPVKQVTVASLKASRFCQRIYLTAAPKDLMDSIQEHGVIMPLLITRDGKIISGHRRWDAARRLGLKTIPAQVVIDSDQLSIESNRQRRKNLEERMNEAEAIRDIEAQKALIRQRSGKKLGPNEDKGTTMGHVAKAMGESESQVAKYFEIKKKRPDILKKIDSGRYSAHSGLKKLRMDENKARQTKELLAEKVKSSIAPVVKFGDFQKLSKDIPDNSIDLILTDPPYLEKNLPLWDDLGAVAARVLKPGGFCVCYCGHFHLPTCMNNLGKHLQYFWLMSVVHAGNCAVVHPRNVIARFKPILVYAKPPFKKPYRGIHDLLHGKKKDKTLHPWGQDVAPFIELIHDFCPSDGHILEPCAGGGSVIQACLETKRKVTAFENDLDAFKILKQRYL